MRVVNEMLPNFHPLMWPSQGHSHSKSPTNPIILNILPIPQILLLTTPYGVPAVEVATDAEAHGAGFVAAVVVLMLILSIRRSPSFHGLAQPLH